MSVFNMTEANNEELRHIFRLHKAIQTVIPVEALNKSLTCDGKHLALIKTVQRKMLWCRRLTYCRRTVLVIFLMVLLIAVTGIWFLRNSNRANRFGGCPINMFLPFDECPVAF